MSPGNLEHASLLFRADLSEHVQKHDGAHDCHGSHACGTLSEEGRIIKSAVALGLVMEYMHFRKEDKHLFAFASGKARS